MYKVSVKNKSEYEFKVEVGGFSFDVGRDGQGGMAPLDVFLAGIGACMGVYVRKYVKDTKLPVSEFEIHIEAELTPKAPYRFETINVSIDLKGAALDEMRKNSLLNFIKNCPAERTVEDGVKIITAII